MIGYKMLTSNGRSLSDKYGEAWYPLPANGQPGAWITVPGNGAYVTELGGDLFAGGIGDIFVEMECEEQVQIESWLKPPYGVTCWRRVRVLRIVPWTEIPADQGQWRYEAALGLSPLNISPKQRRELVMGISADQSFWRKQAAYAVPGLSDADKAILRGENDGKNLRGVQAL